MLYWLRARRSAWLFYAVITFAYALHTTDVTVVVRFLSSFAVLSAFAVAMDNSRFRQPQPATRICLVAVDQIAHQDQLTQLPNRHDMDRSAGEKIPAVPPGQPALFDTAGGSRQL